tara:strand:- start:3278 stop:3541 length:264 start_codon:yes stop_codon:yes gene_type:complete
MDNVINIKELRNKKNQQANNSAEAICQQGFKGLLSSMYENGFPIMDVEFQKDLSIAFKFIHAAVSRKYGLDSPFIEAIDEFKKNQKF